MEQERGLSRLKNDIGQNWRTFVLWVALSSYGLQLTSEKNRVLVSRVMSGENPVTAAQQVAIERLNIIGRTRTEFSEGFSDSEQDVIRGALGVYIKKYGCPLPEIKILAADFSSLTKVNPDGTTRSVLEQAQRGRMSIDIEANRNPQTDQSGDPVDSRSYFRRYSASRGYACLCGTTNRTSSSRQFT